jgi:long-subunit fatty acid transport protein
LGTAGVIWQILVKQGSFNYAMSFYQRYNSQLLFEKIPVTTLEQPLGTGETFMPNITEYIDTYSGAVSYTPEAFNAMSLGIRLDFNFLNFKENILNAYAKSTGFAFGGSIGLTYQLDEDIMLGAFYEFAPGFDEKVITNNSAIDLDAHMPGNIYATVPLDLKLKSDLPDMLNVAFSFRITDTWTSLLDISYIFWQQYSENYKNNVDISSSLLFSLENDMIFSVGFLMTDRDYSNDIDLAFDTNSNLNGLFFMLGLKKEFGNLDMDFAITSSYLGSGDWREQLIGKFGIGYYL